MALPLIAGIMRGAARTAGAMASGGASVAASAGGGGKTKEIAENTKKLSSGSFVKKLAIGMGIVGLLKMSKGFSAVASTFFQIIGAFVDVLVAPFLPLIFKGLGKMASFIPKVQTWAQGLFDKVSTMEGTWLDKGLFIIKEAFTAIKDNILTPLWDTFFAWAKTDGKQLLIDFLTTSKDSIQGAVFGGVKSSFTNACETVKSWAESIWKTMQLIFETIKVEIVSALNLIPGVNLDDKITELEKKQSDLVKELASTKMASNVGGNQMAAGDLSIKSDKTPQQAGSVNYALNGVIFASRDEMYAHHKSLTKEQMDAEERAMYSQQGNGFIYIE